jgi:ABC-2 type transport system permease protein
VTLPPVIRLLVRNFVSSLDPITVLVRFGQPALTIAVLGTMFSQIVPSSATGGESYVSFLVPGMVAFQMVTGGVVSSQLFWMDRRWCMVEQVFSGPFLRYEYLGGLLLTTLSISLVGVGLMMIVALPLIGLPALTAFGVVTVLATVGMGSLVFAGLLIAVGTQIKSANLYFTIQSFLQLFVIFVSTVYYPIGATTPKFVVDAFYCNPLTYAANVVRHAFAGSLSAGDLVSAGVLGLLATLAFGAATWGFLRMDLGPIQ